ncbi:MAG: IS1634 family transposase [Muribaculaceae bacterium]|nr:IS1634 family transposase [Muribaculaceae bacterium]
MFVRKKANRSGSISVVVVDKSGGKFKEVHKVGVASDASDVEALIVLGNKWIREYEERIHPTIDFDGEIEKRRLEQSTLIDEYFGRIENVQLNGCELILDRVFDLVGFGRIEDKVFRQLVCSRLSFPASKAATVEYLKNHFDDDVDLSKIYRYLDKLNDRHKSLVQDISVRHTIEVLGGHIGVMFYDVTTLYFETDHEDELRKTGFSKEGRHSNPQIIFGLLVSLDGYPLAYCIHEGNKYEGHTMLPVINEFVRKYDLNGFIVVADSGLMTKANIAELERMGYKYIIGARIKNEPEEVKRQILSLPKVSGQMHEIDKGGGRRLLVGYSDDRAGKDAHNRSKGVKRLEKKFHSGRLTKENINRRGYNKFLDMVGETKVELNRERIWLDAQWDGLKGYLTNTDIPTGDIFTAYHNLWNVEKAFRIAKSKIEIRPMFHFTRRRIEAHLCICFVALKIYKELERLLKRANIGMSVDKVLNMAKTVTTITIKMPDGQKVTRTMPMRRHQRIAPLFTDEFWVTQ